MKASYKDSMQNVVFGESEKTKIRRVILDATASKTTKQHSALEIYDRDRGIVFGWCWNIPKCETELGK